MGFVRQLNEGVSRIYQSMEKSMLSIPEYVEKNGNVYLTLRNKISNHTKTISDSILKAVQENWSTYNDTQKRILQHLFYYNQATLGELAEVVGIHENNVRTYINQFVDIEEVLVRQSKKKRDKNAKYMFKKL